MDNGGRLQTREILYATGYVSNLQAEELPFWFQVIGLFIYDRFKSIDKMNPNIKTYFF